MTNLSTDFEKTECYLSADYTDHTDYKTKYKSYFCHLICVFCEICGSNTLFYRRINLKDNLVG